MDKKKHNGSLFLTDKKKNTTLPGITVLLYNKVCEAELYVPRAINPKQCFKTCKSTSVKSNSKMITNKAVMKMLTCQ